MYERVKTFVLWLLKVPPEPLDPMGDVQSLRVFRAAPGYLAYMTVAWCLSQTIVLLIGLAVLIPALFASTFAGLELVVVGLALLAAVVFAAQAMLTYFSLRLSYEMRWYKVTDRSLRIRSGVWGVHEMTMTFANVQNISITQGPLERLFMISDVKVQSAGGGASGGHGKGEGAGTDLHVAVFRGVDNPEDIRELMMARLRRVRGTGLGDLDEHRDPEKASEHAGPMTSPELLSLLAEFRDETCALRRAVET